MHATVTQCGDYRGYLQTPDGKNGSFIFDGNLFSVYTDAGIIYTAETEPPFVDPVVGLRKSSGTIADIPYNVLLSADATEKRLGPSWQKAVESDDAGAKRVYEEVTRSVWAKHSWPLTFEIRCKTG